jgi:hypothetical protein
MSRISVSAIIILSIIVCAFVLFAGCGALLTSCSPTKTVRATYTLTKEQPNALLKTPAASKDCHAQMTLTYRYKDDALAGSDDEPPIKYDFGTDSGWFPDPVSRMEHRTLENGKQIYAWTATVDQAAKNEPGADTHYKVDVFYAGGTTVFPANGVEAEIVIDYTVAGTG